MKNIFILTLTVLTIGFVPSSFASAGCGDKACEGEQPEAYSAEALITGVKGELAFIGKNPKYPGRNYVWVKRPDGRFFRSQTPLSRIPRADEQIVGVPTSVFGDAANPQSIFDKFNELRREEERAELESQRERITDQRQKDVPVAPIAIRPSAPQGGGTVVAGSAGDAAFDAWARENIPGGNTGAPKKEKCCNDPTCKD